MNRTADPLLKRKSMGGGWNVRLTPRLHDRGDWREKEERLAEQKSPSENQFCLFSSKTLSHRPSEKRGGEGKNLIERDAVTEGLIQGRGRTRWIRVLKFSGKAKESVELKLDTRSMKEETSCTRRRGPTLTLNKKISNWVGEGYSIYI